MTGRLEHCAVVQHLFPTPSAVLSYRRTGCIAIVSVHMTMAAVPIAVATVAVLSSNTPPSRVEVCCQCWLSSAFLFLIVSVYYSLIPFKQCKAKILRTSRCFLFWFKLKSLYKHLAHLMYASHTPVRWYGVAAAALEQGRVATCLGAAWWGQDADRDSQTVIAVVVHGA